MFFRVNKTENYTVISNYLLRDTRISAQATGIMCRILSLPNNWKFTIKGLAAISKEDYHAIRRIILELESAGYIIRHQEREKSGKWKRIIYDIYETPCSNPEEDETGPDEPEAESDVPPTPRNAAAETDALKLDADTLNRYRLMIRENIAYDLLLSDYGADRDILSGYVEMMAEVCAGKTSIKVSGREIPPDEAEQRFLSLDMHHILYVMECMQNKTSEIRNIRAYTLASLFNAPNTIEQYYTSAVGRAK